MHQNEKTQGGDHSKIADSLDDFARKYSPFLRTTKWLADQLGENPDDVEQHPFLLWKWGLGKILSLPPLQRVAFFIAVPVLIVAVALLSTHSDSKSYLLFFVVSLVISFVMTLTAN